MKSLTRLISESLCLPPDAMTYRLSEMLENRADGWAVLETSDPDFDPMAYARAGHAAILVSDETHTMFKAEWMGMGDGVRITPETGMCDVLWRGQELKLALVTYDDSTETRHYILARSPHLAEDFFRAVCRWSDAVEDSVLVYRGSGWQRDQKLHQAIRNAQWSDLVIAPDLERQIRDDVLGFFKAKEHYSRFGIPWKRGVLFLGPPGNGKTNVIKLIAKEAGVPSLYVRSFAAYRGTPQSSIQEVFRRARNTAPCLLILEDLDSLIDAKSLSVFLNEMDGFAVNEGVLALATTNHPEKLDPALLHRPSRFDRKVMFDLPSFEIRAEYLRRLSAKWDEAMRLSEESVQSLATATHEFSFAYLKEASISSMLEWMRDNTRPMGQVMHEVVEQLKTQMSEAMPKEEVDDEE